MRLLDIAVAYRLSSFCPVPYKIDELSRSKLQGIRIRQRDLSSGHHPECFNRWSSSNLAWIPAKSMRE